LTTARTVQSYACLLNAQRVRGSSRSITQARISLGAIPVLIRPRGRQAWVAISMLHQIPPTD
jgi:hypothetical protein